MVQIEKGLNIDSNRLIRRALAILPERNRYFMDIINVIKKKYPALKLIYASNLTGQTLNPDRPVPDFVLVIKGNLVSPNPKEPDKSIILVDCPLIFTERSIAGWTIAVEEGNMDGYLKYMLDKALRIDESRFYEYITNMALLTLDKNDERYWKSPKNALKVATELEELYTRYNRKNSTRMTDARGYTGAQLPKPDKPDTTTP